MFIYLLHLLCSFTLCHYMSLWSLAPSWAPPAPLASQPGPATAGVLRKSTRHHVTNTVTNVSWNIYRYRYLWYIYIYWYILNFHIFIKKCNKSENLSVQTCWNPASCQAACRTPPFDWAHLQWITSWLWWLKSWWFMMIYDVLWWFMTLGLRFTILNLELWSQRTPWMHLLDSL